MKASLSNIKTNRYDEDYSISMIFVKKNEKSIHFNGR